ncbi:Mannosyl-oligosaccharide 1,2-alpha-mannosidase [Fusarium oxysporum]|uniref:alpha-1,2-Mannosidase n=1 Tax=Fusarium oxysporum Fo47 TaxID=660027 RepID=W9L8R3_FUSOX|nr:glycoside hydrolase [Fusarium oxysporum Fo47]KAJ4126848.1 mannosyl-oligosaccharide alpha-1,2-mannosidase [Fusarium oxysporum]EWZ50710.1 mannosyl-oligosaccharide alpha-1,2-mannosidase [Fusarium oxysporum Fo47]KAJ4278380.1 mannosyl-oligosaccharide alpha-1,2-mannosidase [Fusarium oxysporum]QKD47529.1 glycoside hydrolase [Fusarium oxysporum Fo47]RKL45555.1 Mannosyl-oligosaccharide 1,2-alpha-mannosidase [Fusarium oxysporum]
MIRDPFNIHRTTSTFGRPQSRNIPAQSQAEADEVAMAFSMPRTVPSFDSRQRELEDRFWGSGQRSNKSDRLPMYKDKPYASPYDDEYRPFWKRKKWMAIIAFVVLTLIYWTGSSKKPSPKRTVTTDWSYTGLSKDDRKANWDHRRDRVVEAFELSWDAYKRYAWGFDEYHPISKTGENMAPKGLGWIIIDSLDTMILMNLTSRVQDARHWISDSLTWDQDQDVNTFETTIRMLGGLLSAHYLSTEFPGLAPLAEDDEGAAGEDLYLEKAKDLADRLMSAFDSPSGIPYASVNLAKFEGIPSHADMGASSTAEATTLQLEFKYLAKLTGEKDFWDRVENVMKLVDNQGAQDGLVPIFIYATSGEFRGENIRLGSRGDSYYEYLIKQYLQTNKQEPIYQDMWYEALQGVRKHLVTYTSNSKFTIIGERPNGLEMPLSPKMDHLVCFMPGTIALAATEGLTEAQARKLPTWSKKNEEDMQLAREVMETCWGMYKYMATGLSAEITYFEIDNPPTAYGNPRNGPVNFDTSPDAEWRKDFTVKSGDVHNLQRPETVESLFYMWRITNDNRYREWGWEMFKSFMNHTAVRNGGGFTSLRNANVVPPKVRDNMESFWLAETLKYFYLLFSPPDLLPLDKVVINTEGHPLPRFDMGQLFSTGWKRKPRDANGKIIATAVKVESKEKEAVMQDAKKVN